MDRSDLTDLIDGLRRIGGEPESVEVKAAGGGLPKSIRETLSAFSNTDGGTIVLGIDEDAGFTPVPLEDPVKLRNALAQAARDDMTPALQISTDILELDGHRIVVADIPRVPDDRRPVYVTSRGIANGAFLRAGDDGDRRMTEAEVGLMIGNRTQPTYDREPVAGTSLSDLDQDSVTRTLIRARRTSPSLARASNETALRRIGVLAEPTEDSPVTLAGLLAFGEYPQEHFPQLMVSVVVHPPGNDGENRFLDNASVRGSIPEMVQQTLDLLRRNLAARASMTATGREDHLEFPLIAVREAVVNALMHRDYSGITRGTQVQVELFPDRLEVRSPGGIFGGIAVDELGDEGISSSRNASLASLLSDTYMPSSSEVVAENRASGVPAMIVAARTHGLPRPAFRSTVSSFVVTFNRSQLLSPAVRTWIDSLQIATTPAHEIALAMLRVGPVSNADLRRWGSDAAEAGRVLRDLVAARIAIKEGGRRYATYVLDPRVSANEMPERAPASAILDGPVAQALRAAGRQMSAKELTEITGASRPTVVAQLNQLIEVGVVAAHGAPRSPHRSYAWVSFNDASADDRPI